MVHRVSKLCTVQGTCKLYGGLYYGICKFLSHDGLGLDTGTQATSEFPSRNSGYSVFNVQIRRHIRFYETFYIALIVTLLSSSRVDTLPYVFRLLRSRARLSVPVEELVKVCHIEWHIYLG